LTGRGDRSGRTLLVWVCGPHVNNSSRGAVVAPKYAALSDSERG